MIKRIGKKSEKALHVYITEHMKAQGLNDAQVAGRLDPPVAPVTVWRWRNQQSRLKPAKIAALAHALDLDSHLDLYRPPGRESIDAHLQDAPEDVYEAVRDLAAKLSKTGT